MNPGTRAATALALAAQTLALLTVVTAQTRPPNAPGQSPQPVFRASVEGFITTASVKDSKGRFIYGLKPDQFEIYEDGVLQHLTFFNPVAGGRSLNPSTTPEVPKPREGIIRPARVQATDASGRIFIIFIDDLHLDVGQGLLARDVLRQVRDNLIKDNDLIAIVSSGFSSIAVNLNYDYDHKRLNESIEQLMGSGPSIQDIIRAADSLEGPVGIRYNAHVALKTVYGLLDQVAPINDKRKAFIYVSAGYDFDPYRDARLSAEMELYGKSINPQELQASSGTLRSPTEQMTQSGMDSMNPFAKTGNRFAESDLIGELAELIRAANRANATFYTLDPRGLIAGSDISVKGLTQNDIQNHNRTTINSLRAIAENTGGFCACEINNYKQALERIDNETSDYYVLGYKSSNPDLLKTRRKLEIKVKVPGATVVTQPDLWLKRPESVRR